MRALVICLSFGYGGGTHARKMMASQSSVPAGRGARQLRICFFKRGGRTEVTVPRGALQVEVK